MPNNDKWKDNLNPSQKSDNPRIEGPIQNDEIRKGRIDEGLSKEDKGNSWITRPITSETPISTGTSDNNDE